MKVIDTMTAVQYTDRCKRLLQYRINDIKSMDNKIDATIEGLERDIRALKQSKDSHKKEITTLENHMLMIDIYSEHINRGCTTIEMQLI